MVYACDQKFDQQTKLSLMHISEAEIVNTLPHLPLSVSFFEYAMIFIKLSRRSLLYDYGPMCLHGPFFSPQTLDKGVESTATF